jgi:hypothetical protein
MSKLSFKTYCIELYAEHTNTPSNEIYAMFKERGVLDMLDRDYDLLHGFGFEYIMRDIDEYLKGIEA